MASLALLAIKLRTIPTGSANRTARSVVTSPIFSRASASIPALIRSRSKRASFAEDAYWRSPCNLTQPLSTSTLGKRQRVPVIFGQISMKSDKPTRHSDEEVCRSCRIVMPEVAEGVAVLPVVSSTCER